MSKYLLSAAAAVLSIIGSTGAFALDDCNGDKGGWEEVQVGGATQTICYHGGSGNDVDCESSGNHVVVTTTSAGYTVLQHPQFGEPGHPQEFTQCKVPDSETAASCDISRSLEVGSTNFGYCG